MPSSYMPLRSAFIAAAQAGVDRTYFSRRLLRDLQNGEIRAICASYIKAQFLFSAEGRDYSEVIDQLILPEKCKSDEKKKKPKFVDAIYNIWIDRNYYTFVKVERGVVVYADHFPERAPGGELNHEFLDVVLMNEKLSEIYCVDVPNQLRRIYEKVELLRSDVNNMLCLPQNKVKAKRGAKQKYHLDKRVYEIAKNLLRMNYSRTEWEGRVREHFSATDQEMREKKFHELYGRPLWTAHHDMKRGN